MLRWFLLVIIGLAFTGCNACSESPADSGAFARYQSAELTEPSGLVASRKNPGVFWTHNDSGDEARLFAVTADGQLLGEYAIEGATAIDWEAITTDASGRLYVADFGNNFNDRRDLVIYVVAEPDVEIGRAASTGAFPVERVIPFHYPDQNQFPDNDRLNFDAEAIFWAEGRLYILTKHRSDLRTTLYRLDDSSPTDSVALVRLDSFEVGGDPRRYGGRVTGADLSTDGQYLAVLCYHAVFIFERPESGDNYLSRTLNRIELSQESTGQVEAIAWDGNALLLTNEAGMIYRIEQPLLPRVEPFPEVGQ